MFYKSWGNRQPNDISTFVPPTCPPQYLLWKAGSAQKLVLLNMAGIKHRLRPNDSHSYGFGIEEYLLLHPAFYRHYCIRLHI